MYIHMALKHAEWKTVLFGKSLEEGEGRVFGCLDNWECWVWRCQVLMGTQKAETSLQSCSLICLCCWTVLKNERGLRMVCCWTVLKNERGLRMEATSHICTSTGVCCFRGAHLLALARKSLGTRLAMRLDVHTYHWSLDCNLCMSHLLVTPAQLVRLGIGWNASCTVDDCV